MANITLMGASYTDVPAIDLPQTGGGTVRFYENGGGGVSRETIVPATTVSATAGSWARLTSGNTPSFTEGEYYAYTINGIERVATATLTGNNIYLSDIEYDWGGDGFAVAYDTVYGGIWFNASATSGEYTVKVDKLTLSGGGTIQDYEDALVAFGVQSNLASGIIALTTYANEITGESDTTLSDAVRSLADGYGGTIYFNATGLMYTANYESPATEQTTQLYGCGNLETVYAPNATTCGQYAGGRDCKALKSVHFPKCTTFPQYFIRQQGGSYNKLESVTVGSIGYPVTSLAYRWRYGSHAQTLTVTIYVNAETLADIPTSVSTYAAGDNVYAPSGSVVNVVYRNSNTGNVITA